MPYCNLTQVQNLMANTLTSASPQNTNQPVDLMRIGTTFDFNVVDSVLAQEYIKLADEEIDATISELYVTPLEQTCDFETRLLSDINDYNDFIITTDYCPFYVGDELLLTNGVVEERHIVARVIDIENMNIFETLDPIVYMFSASNTRVLRIKYPDPIPLMSMRWSAATIYEKYFMAEASPSESEYGKWMRGLVRADINNILNGRAILHGAHRIGRRFYNPTLVDQYGLPHAKGENDMEIPS